MLASLLLISAAVLLLHRTIRTRPMSIGTAALVFAGLALWISYYVADALTGSGIDASVAYHLAVGFEGAAMADFAWIGVIALLMLGLAAMIAFAVYRFVRAGTPGAPGNPIRVAAAVAAFAGAFYFNAAVGDITALLQTARAASAPVSADLPEHFAPPAPLRFDGPPRNFVILYLESVERTYLDAELFPGLMPDLAALEARALRFTDIGQVEGTDWTISGIVASLCGVPLAATGANNAMSGVDRFLPGATCLGDLLAEQGYALHFLGGADLDFAGKGKFLSSHGFERVEGLEELRGGLTDPGYLSAWGLYDDTLYAEAIARFDTLARGDQPFGLVALTLDTHHPDGYLSRACGETRYGDGGNAILSAVHCADRMAGAFIRHVMESPAFANTVLVVMSDHLAMPNSARDRLAAGQRRNLLYLLGPGITPAADDRPGSTLDLAPTLLSLLGAETAAFGYGRSLLAAPPTLVAEVPDIDAVLLRDSGFVATLWSFPQVRDGIRADLVAERLWLGERHLALPALLLLDDDLVVTDVRFEFYENTPLAEQIAMLADDQRFLWVDHCAKTSVLAPAAVTEAQGFCALAGTLGGGALDALVLADGALIGLDDLRARLDADVPEPGRVDARFARLQLLRDFGTAEVVNYSPQSSLVGDFALKSAGFGKGTSAVTNRALDARVELSRGLTLLGLRADLPPEKLAHVDTCAYDGVVVADTVGIERDFRTEMKRHAPRFGAFAIVGHDSVLCYGVDTDLGALFDGTGLVRWEEIGFQQPYIGLVSGTGERAEYLGAPQTILAVEARNFIAPPGQGPIPDSLERPEARLARVGHAGGGYEGVSYTNSLEALNRNRDLYEIFEIDLSWTSDDALVCVHDWEGHFGKDFGFIPQDGAISLARFEALVAAQTRYHNCTLDSLAEWMRDNPDKRIVLDIKDRVLEALELIAARHPALQHRFIAQIYAPGEYVPARAMGYNDVVWTLYLFGGSDAQVLRTLDFMDLYALSMPVERAQDGLARAARERTGVLTWAHTVNTAADLTAMRELGVEEIFTDFLPEE